MYDPPELYVQFAHKTHTHTLVQTHSHTRANTHKHTHTRKQILTRTNALTHMQARTHKYTLYKLFCSYIYRPVKILL